MRIERRSTFDLVGKERTLLLSTIINLELIASSSAFEILKTLYRNERTERFWIVMNLSANLLFNASTTYFHKVNILSVLDL